MAFLFGEIVWRWLEFMRQTFEKLREFVAQTHFERQIIKCLADFDAQIQLERQTRRFLMNFVA